MIDQPMHLRVKKGMLVFVRSNKSLIPSLVISDVYLLKEMFHMVDVVFKGKKRKIRTTWIKEIYV